MLNNRSRLRIRITIRWILFFVITALCFSISTTGGTGKPQPLLLIPLVISIGAFENEFVSGITGAVCGFLLDISMGKLIGTNALLLLMVGTVTSLLFLHLLRKNLINILVITSVVAFIQGMYDFFFYYSIWSEDHHTIVFKKMTLPSIAYTVISVPFIYYLIKFIEIKTNNPDSPTIEEKDDNHSRL